MKNMTMRQALETLDQLDDFVCGVPASENPRDKVVAVRNFIQESFPEHFDYYEKMTSITRALAEIADAYGGTTLYNDYLNKSIQTLTYALRVLEDENHA